MQEYLQAGLGLYWPVDLVKDSVKDSGTDLGTDLDTNPGIGLKAELGIDLIPDLDSNSTHDLLHGFSGDPSSVKGWGVYLRWSWRVWASIME